MINHCKHSTQKESYEQLSRRLPVSKCEFKKKYKVTLQTVNIDGHHHDSQLPENSTEENGTYILETKISAYMFDFLFSRTTVSISSILCDSLHPTTFCRSHELFYFPVHEQIRQFCDEFYESVNSSRVSTCEVHLPVNKATLLYFRNRSNATPVYHLTQINALILDGEISLHSAHTNIWSASVQQSNIDTHTTYD